MTDIPTPPVIEAATEERVPYFDQPVLSVPAVRGHQGNTTYYTASFPFGMAAKLFTYDPDKITGIPIAQRHQRHLKKSRVPEIADYIVANDDYLFSSIVVSVDSDNLVFSEGLYGSVGLLELPMEAEWIVNDGQHRLAGIAEAIRRNPERRHDTLSVIVLPDAGLERAQQVFSDLNRTAQKTSHSVDILFDRRLPVNRISCTVADKTVLFRGKVDKERSALPAKSGDFVTLTALAAANEALLGDLPSTIDDETYKRAEDFAIYFWARMSQVIVPWGQISDGTLTPVVAREDYLSVYAVALQAIAAAGRYAVETQGTQWPDALERLRNVDWRKSNPLWADIVQDGRVVTRGPTRRALAERLRAVVAGEPVNQG
jgi:DNA sulfur modification protein DndB